MPNWITNKVQINEINPQKLENFQNSLLNDEKEVDFEIVAPMPEELKDTVAPSKIPNKTLLKKYGVDNWYDWSNENWGTKWNASNTIINSDTIIFQTAWNTPIEYFLKLSKRNLVVEFQVKYADEDIGSNCGILTFLKGEMIDYIDMEDNEEFALEVIGF